MQGSAGETDALTALLLFRVWKSWKSEPYAGGKVWNICGKWNIHQYQSFFDVVFPGSQALDVVGPGKHKKPQMRPSKVDWCWRQSSRAKIAAKPAKQPYTWLMCQAAQEWAYNVEKAEINVWEKIRVCRLFRTHPIVSICKQFYFHPTDVSRRTRKSLPFPRSQSIGRQTCWNCSADIPESSWW